jgi:hypothetical protein
MAQATTIGTTFVITNAKHFSVERVQLVQKRRNFLFGLDE